jgi:hypothetical protein
MNIDRILLIIIIIYLILSHSKKNKNIEKFALSVDDKNEVITLIKNELKPALKEIYNTDMQAVRDLDKLAKDIQSGGYTVNGNLKVTGTLDNKTITDTLSTYNTTFQNNYTTFETKINKAIEDMNTNLSKYIKYGDRLYLWSDASPDPYGGRSITLVTQYTYFTTPRQNRIW